MGSPDNGFNQKLLEKCTFQATKRPITPEELQFQDSSSSSSSDNGSTKHRSFPEVCLENSHDYGQPAKRLKRYSGTSYDDIMLHADNRMEANLQPFMSTTSLHPQQANWFHYQRHMELNGSRIPEYKNAIMDTVYNDVPILPLAVLRPNSSDSNRMMEVKQFDEKAEERRQKRMIKNRESAARSRQRKQEYVNRLENEISDLKDWNGQQSVYVNKFENQIRTLQNQFSELKDQNEGLKKQYVSLENQINLLKNQVGELKDENEGYKKQTVMLENQISKLTNKFCELKNEDEDLKKQLEGDLISTAHSHQMRRRRLCRANSVPF